MRFEMAFALDGEGMRTGNDVAAVLRRVADEIEATVGAIDMQPAVGRVRDVNGNRRGYWGVEAFVRAAAAPVEFGSAGVLRDQSEEV